MPSVIRNTSISSSSWERWRSILSISLTDEPMTGTQPAYRWYARRFQQVFHSIPHYISELRDIHNFREASEWAYFKFPYAFRMRNFPPRATVEFTNHCNFSCGYCPRSVMSRSVGDMDAGLFRRIVRE